MIEQVVAPDESHERTDIAGRSVVLSYGDVAAEYAALRRRAVIIDQSHRGRMRITGPKAAEMVAGLVTNDVSALVPGHGCYAAALTAKGRVIADPRIYVDSDALFIDTPGRASAGWLATVRKFVNPRVAPYHDDTDTTCAIGVYGVDARHVVEAMTGLVSSGIATLPPYAHADVDIDGMHVRVAQLPDLAAAGLEAFELYAPTALRELLWSRATHAAATPAGNRAWEIARVEAGRPEWGIDMDDNTIPQEANLDDLHAISYTKGCYVGQEVVARVHFRGHVNRHLRGLRAEGAPPPSGAQLFADEARDVGDVRSSVISPRLGGIAIAMVRREVEPGTTLVARWDGGQTHVTVEALPFSA